MRLILLLALTLSACVADPHALTYTQTNAPIWNINPALWNGDTNTLTTPPTLPIGAPVR